MLIQSLAQTRETIYQVAKLAEGLLDSAIMKSPISYAKLPDRYLEPGLTQEIEILSRMKIRKGLFNKSQTGHDVHKYIQLAQKRLKALDEYEPGSFTNAMRHWKDGIDSFLKQPLIRNTFDELSAISHLPKYTFAFLSWLDNIVTYYPNDFADHKQVIEIAKNIKNKFLKYVKPIFENLEDYFVTLMNANIRGWPHSMASTVEMKPTILKEMGLPSNYLRRFLALAKDHGDPHSAPLPLENVVW